MVVHWGSLGKRGVVVGALRGIDGGPRDAADLPDTFSNGVGSMTIDVRELTIDNPRSLTIDNGVCSIDVYLPENTPISLECDTGFGARNAVSLTNAPIHYEAINYLCSRPFHKRASASFLFSRRVRMRVASFICATNR